MMLQSFNTMKEVGNKFFKRCKSKTNKKILKINEKSENTPFMVTADDDIFQNQENLVNNYFMLMITYDGKVDVLP